MAGIFDRFIKTASGAVIDRVAQAAAQKVQRDAAAQVANSPLASNTAPRPQSSAALDLPWIAEGKKFLGLAEIPGAAHNKTIQGWLRALRAWWDDDETPWCGVFVAHCAQVAGLAMPKEWMRAKEWNTVGIQLTAPAVGCIVTFTRQGGGHVGFVVGKDQRGNLMVLGGNQGNKVSIAPFSPGRVSQYRFPVNKDTKAVEFPINYNLPVISSNGRLSTNEA